MNSQLPRVNCHLYPHIPLYIRIYPIHFVFHPLQTRFVRHQPPIIIDLAYLHWHVQIQPVMKTLLLGIKGDFYHRINESEKE